MRPYFDQMSTGKTTVAETTKGRNDRESGPNKLSADYFCLNCQPQSRASRRFLCASKQLRQTGWARSFAHTQSAGSRRSSGAPPTFGLDYASLRRPSPTPTSSASGATAAPASPVRGDESRTRQPQAGQHVQREQKPEPQLLYYQPLHPQSYASLQSPQHSYGPNQPFIQHHQAGIYARPKEGGSSRVEACQLGALSSVSFQPTIRTPQDVAIRPDAKQPIKQPSENQRQHSYHHASHGLQGLLPSHIHAATGGDSNSRRLPKIGGSMPSWSPSSSHHTASKQMHLMPTAKTADTASTSLAGGCVN
ncbi:unnamed protein product [Protopolystoma xenopodis]|uniref:Uncharacterized protein n=1 Tax=Protopolystoma xenopodis TaxID=117903 RepID=A0A448XAR5_9PLAT|nr:unnamed protein product [Protopolystoma xenopodis]